MKKNSSERLHPLCLRVAPLLLLFSLILSSLSCATSGSVTHKRQVPRGKAAQQAPSNNTVQAYLRSEMQLRRNDLKGALSSLDEAIAQDATQSAFWQKRAVIEAAMGHIEKAKENTLEALKLSPSAESYVLLGKIHQSQGNPDEAIQAYQKALQLKSSREFSDSETRLLLIEAYIAKKEVSRAWSLVREWEKADPENLTPLFYEASLLQNFFKNKAGAIAAYKKILDQDPENMKALSALADLYASQKNDEGLIDVFEQMEAVNPNDPNLGLKMAILYYTHKDYDRAIQKFQEVLKSQPHADRIIYYLGLIYETRNQPQKAFLQLEKVPENSELFKDARLHMAFLKRKGGEEEGAITLLEEAIQKKPDVSDFYQFLSEIYRDQEEYEKAIETLKRGVSHSKAPETVETLEFNQAMIYDRMGEYDEGIDLMQKILKKNPNHAGALNYIGYSWADRDLKLEEAQALIEKAAKLKPGDGYITDSLGWVHFKRGNLKEARKYLLQAYQLISKEPAILEHLGDLFLAEHKRENARDSYRKALRLIIQATKKKPASGPILKDQKRLEEKIREIQ